MAKADVAPKSMMSGNWQAESDAACIMTYHKIKSDKKRFQAALAELRKKRDEAQSAVDETVEETAEEKAGKS